MQIITGIDGDMERWEPSHAADENRKRAGSIWAVPRMIKRVRPSDSTCRYLAKGNENMCPLMCPRECL